MPEGPEVTRIAKQLNEYIQNGDNTLISIWPLSGRYTKSPIPGLIDLHLPTVVKAVYNHGKFIYWELANEKYIFSTLGMTGGYLPYLDNYARVQFNLNGRIIYYTDIRNFGTFKITNEVELVKKLKTLGPDMLNVSCSDAVFSSRFRKYPNMNIASALMEQKIISGVGNIYKSESLYWAGLHPMRKISSLTDQELIKLRESVVNVLFSAYKAGGSTIRNYKDFYGEEGQYTNGDPAKLLSEKYQRAVYGKSKDPKGFKVERIFVGDGRTTYYVKELQK